VYIHGRQILKPLADRFPCNGYSGDAIVVVLRVLAGPIDEEILLLINQVLSLVLAHFEVWRELNRVRWTSFFAEAAKDAAREVDSEEGRVPPSTLVLCRLESYTVDRASSRAKITSHATFSTVRVAR